MKTLLSIFAGLAVFLTGMSVSAQQQKATPSSDSPVTLDKVWIDYDVTQGKANGIVVHAALTLKGMKGVPAQLRFTLLDSENEPIVDSDGEFAEDGVVSVAKYLAIPSDPTVLKDERLFIPYAQFELEDGKYSLGIDVDVVDDTGELIAHLAIEEFEYEQGEVPVEENGVSAVIENLVIQQNVTREGKVGILAKLTLDQVTGLKGVTSGLAMRVFDMDDDPLMANSEAYASESGHLVTVFIMKPAFDPAKFENVELFIPYDEFVVSKGTRKLKLDFDLISDDWETLKHLEFREFEMVKK